MTDRMLVTASAVSGALMFVVAGVVAHRTALPGLRLVVLGAAIGAIVPIDLHEHRIPNRIVLPAIGASVPFAVLAGPSSVALSGLALVVLMLLVALLQPAAIGMGDVKLALLLAVGLGTSAPDAILASIMLAAAYGLVLMTRHGASAGRIAIPLAPFFASGVLLGLLV